MRLGAERKKDIDRMLDFALYLKKNNIKSILINIYGERVLSKYLIEKIFKQELQSIVVYCGQNNDLKEIFCENDVCLDFSYFQSFGMAYIEAILNGKMIYCYSNEGANNVLREIPDAIVSSHKEMFFKIINTHNIKCEQLKNNYDVILNRFSRDIVSSNLESLINF